MNMNNLLKKYTLYSNLDYYELVIKALNDGEQKQAIGLFLAMPKKYRKEFVAILSTNYAKRIDDSNLRLLIQTI